jgi:hypothetical protein
MNRRRATAASLLLALAAAACSGSGGPSGGDTKSLPGVTVTVPSLVGRRVSEALLWIQRAELFYEVREVPPLPPSDARHLFDAYTVARQSPEPGTRLAPGVIERDGFRPTPIVLWPSLNDR